MNPRERYLQTLLFGKPDKVPFQPGGPRESTLEAWHKQGLPEGANHHTALLEILGIEPEQIKKPWTALGVSTCMIPTFEEKVLEHKDGHYIVQDWMGAITEISDKYDYTYIRGAKDFVTRKWHKFPVENRKEWEKMKERYDPKTPGRVPADLDEKAKILKDRDYQCSIGINGPFWQMREWCGMENLCILMLDDPDLIMDMAKFWTEFISETLKPIRERVALDSVTINEDMSYKAHSMISPAMVRKFIMPSYNRWVPELKSSGCPIVIMDSDGHIGELLPLWIEAGINCHFPAEVAAGNDVVEYRRLYGKKMAYIGCIDKRAMARGGKVMEREVMRVVPPLLKDGGIIPGCDHGVPPDISWPNFIEYSRLLAKLTGWL